MRLLLILAFIVCCASYLDAQTVYCAGNCNTGVSTCYSDTLASSTDTLTISLFGDGLCCTGFTNGASTNYNCAQMLITVPPGTEGLEFGYNGPNQCAIDVHELQNGCPLSRNNGTSICDPYCPNQTTYCEGEANAEDVTFIFTLCKEGNFNTISLDIIGVPKICMELEDTNEDCDVTFIVSEGATWSANPASGLSYLSCLDCTHPVFSYTGPAVTDCNGIQFEYTTSHGATLCDVAQSVTDTMTVYPTLDGVITTACMDECRTEMTYNPDVPCPDIVYNLLNSLGDTLETNSTGVFDVPSDNTYYSIEASRPGTPECWNTETILAAPETVPPYFTSFPSDTTLYLETSSIPDTLTTSIGYPTAADNCDLNPAISYVDDISGLSGCSNTGVLYRTYTATDDCGNTSTQVQTVMVQDTTAPVILTCPPDVDDITGCDTLDVAGLIGGLIYSVVPVVITEQQFTDVGGSWSEANNVTITYVDDISDSTCPNPIIVVTRTFTVTDDCGNYDSCQQALEFYDYTEPSVTCPPPLLAVDGCDETYVTVASTGLDYSESPMPVTTPQYLALGGTMNDVCGFLSVEYYDTSVPDDCPNATLVVTRTFVVTDQCDNTASCQQTIEVYDLSGPEVLTHPDITVNCDSVPAYSDPVAVDDCYYVTQISYAEDTISQSCLSEYVLEREWVFEDSCGNQTIHTQLINVIDTVPPAIICPGGMTLIYDSSCVVDTTLSFTGFPTITEECSGSFTWTYSDDDSGINEYNGLGTIIRTFDAVDPCGNTESCQQIITLDGEFCGDGCPRIYTNRFLMYKAMDD